MAETKEYREFFLRINVVSSGTKPDQEAAFDTSYYIGSSLVYNRFLKNNYPTEKVFRKLFESITFKKNIEDTAKLSEQGLVKIASDDNARDRTSNASNDFTAAVVPHQLPEVVGVTSGGTDAILGSVATVGGISITKYIRTITGRFRLIYKLAIATKQSIEVDTDGSVHLKGDADTPGNAKVYGTKEDGTLGYYNALPLGVIVMFNSATIPTGWNICDGTNGTPDLRGRFVVATGQNATPASGETVNPNYALNAIGGENTHALVGNELPKHGHKGVTATKGGAVGNVIVAGSDNTGSGGSIAFATDDKVWVYPPVGPEAESSYLRHENRPSFFALVFIMKIAF